MAIEQQTVEGGGGRDQAQAPVELPWAILRKHSLLACVRVHEDGDGALLWLSSLSRCFSASPELTDWAAEAQQLIELTRRSGLRHGTSITNRLNEDAVWRSLAQCIEARQKAAETGLAVDMLLARYVVGLVAERGIISGGFLDGCTQLYKAGQRKHNRTTRREWQDLLEVLQSGHKPLATHILTITSTTCRDFSIAADRVLKSRISSVQSAISVKALELLEATSSTSINTTDSIDPSSAALAESTQPSPVIDAADDSQEEQAQAIGFKLGDSVSQYIRDQSAFVARRTRLGLEHRSSAPIAHVLEIAQHSRTALANATDPMQRASALMIQLQLTLPVPLFVLLSLKCRPGNDIWLDVTKGSLQVTRQHITGSSTVPAWFESTNTWSIRLTGDAARLLKQYASSDTSAEHLGDLLTHQEIALADLEHAHQQMLRHFSDPHLQTWPSHWLAGVRAASVALLGSELVAAYVMSYPGLGAEGALHYFHPPQKQLDEMTSRWHAALGLGDQSGLHEVRLVATPEIFGNHRIRTGFTHLVQDIKDLQRQIGKSRGDVREVLPDFKQLTAAVASLAVFVTAGRGMKIEEIKNGSLLFHDRLIHIDDKDVINGRGSRLIPRPDALTWATDVFLDVQTLVASRLCTASGIRQTDSLLELSSRHLRFDAVCFQYFTVSAGVVQRIAVTATDIEVNARKYFDAPRNFMRHVIITHWTLSGEDRTALRALTGHAWNWSEVPGPCTTYSPISLIQSIKAPLERILSHWLPAQHSSRLNAAHTLLHFPARRIHKVHKHYRSFIEDGTQGPVFSRWHLASDTFSQSVREDLTLDRSSGSKELLLWLHLVFIDGLTEPEDLEAMLATPSSFSRSSSGWCVSWARSGDAPEARSLRLQAPTALYLERIGAASLALPASDIDHELASWLSGRCGAGTSKDASPSKASLVLTSIASLWTDLTLPTSLQVAYCPANRAPIPTKRSSFALIHGTSTHTVPIGQFANPSTARAHHSGCLQQLIKLIHRVGDNTQRLGEQKSRAAYLLEHVNALGSWDEGSWTDVLISALRHNIELIRASSSRALQFSSISTYTSALSHFIADHEDINFAQADELETKHLSHQLLKHASDRDARGSSDVTSAALWLLTSMKRQGHSVDLEVVDIDEWRTRPASVSLIPMIADQTIDQAKSMLMQAHADSTLHQEQITVALELLRSRPMRWMELAALDPTHVLDQHDTVRIEASGYSHIKSASSVRNIGVAKDLYQRLKSLATRVSHLHESSRPLLFSRAAAGEDPTLIPSWIHQEISWTMKYLLEDTFRIHHLRANAITQSMFPGWHAIFRRWVLGQANDKEISKLFEYSPAQASRCEKTAVQAGHSHPATTVTYYLFAWPLLRTLAMADCNVGLVPGPQYLEHLGISRAAWVKAAQRRRDLPTDPWSYLSRRAFGIKPVESDLNASHGHSASLIPPTEPGNHTGPNSGEQQSPTNLVRYLCLRACGVPAARATDFTRLSPRQSADLEDLYSVTDKAEKIALLRARQGSSSGDRSSTAEVRLVQSDVFLKLIEIASRACAPQLLSLVSLLTPRLNQRTCTEQEINELAALFDSSEFAVELVFREKGADPVMAARLERCPSVLAVHSVRDLAAPLRGFVVERSGQTTLVAKSRLRSVFSLICYFLHLVRHEGTNEKVKETSIPTNKH